MLQESRPEQCRPAVPLAASALGLLLCNRWGYDLVGLPADGACPECGLAIRESARGEMLKNSSPAYLRRLHWGAAVMVASAATDRKYD
jgi:hypothetical protein